MQAGLQCGPKVRDHAERNASRVPDVALQSADRLPVDWAVGLQEGGKQIFVVCCGNGKEI